MNATPSSIAVRSVPTQGRRPDRQRGNCTVLLGELFSDSATAAIFLPRRPRSRETPPIPHSFFGENAFWASRSQPALPDVLHLQIFSLKVDSPAQNPALQMWRVQCGPRGPRAVTIGTQPAPGSSLQTLSLVYPLSQVSSSWGMLLWLKIHNRLFIHIYFHLFSSDPFFLKMPEPSKS